MSTDPTDRIVRAIETAATPDTSSADACDAWPPYDDTDEPEPPEPPRDGGAVLETLARCAGLEQNDTDNGQRLLAHFGRELLHVREVGWHLWTGQRWQRDGGDEAAVRLAQRTAKRIHLEADHMAALPHEQRAVKAAEAAMAKPESARSEGDKALIRDADEAREALKKRRIGRRKFAVSSGNGGRIAAMIAQALPHSTKAPTDLDADPLLLNLENGTLRFSKVEDPENPCEHSRRYTLAVERLDHDRDHLNTKLAPVAYDPEATCTNWEAFLERFQPKPAIRRFLQAYHGLALTGQTGQQCFIFNYGTGANGKSTFSEAIAALMGSYSDLLNAESLTGQGQRRGDQATPDFADLPGTRYLRISELPRGEPLKEALVKSLTGGEEIKARHLNKGFFKFWPVFKASMSGNDMPSIGGVDNGIWRRVRLVPWEVTIPDDERRPMDEVLAEFAAERPGILNWLIEGLRIYVTEGLQVPAEVQQATAAYREEMDPIAAFAADCIIREPGASETARTVYEAFVSWCLANAVRPWKETAFGRAMPHKGFERENGRVRRYLDVRLHDVPARPDERPGQSAIDRYE